MNKSHHLKVSRKGSQQCNLALLDWFKKRHNVHPSSSNSFSPYPAHIPARKKEEKQLRKERKKEGRRKEKGKKSKDGGTLCTEEETSSYGINYNHGNRLMTFTLKMKEWQWNLCEVCVTPVPDVYSTVVLCLCNMRGFRRNEYSRTPQSSAYAIDNADMSIMLPREKAGRRQIAAVVPAELTSWTAITQTNKRDQRQHKKSKPEKCFPPVYTGGGVKRWGWGDSEFDFSLLNKVPIKSLQLTADNYFQLEETVLKLLIWLPAKRTKCVYLSHFQKGGKGDLGVRWGRTMEQREASMHWGNSWAPCVVPRVASQGDRADRVAKRVGVLRERAVGRACEAQCIHGVGGGVI